MNSLRPGAPVLLALTLFVSPAFAQEATTSTEVSKDEAAETDATAEDETAPSESVPTAKEESVDEGAKMRELEERVNELKEKIFRSKARLMLLRETVLNGAIAGAKAIIIHKNEMGSNFILERATYSLDGAPIFSQVNDDDNDELADAESIELFNGSIVPGNHNISVQLVFRGNGFGLFSYLSGYKFNIKSSYAFTAEEGKLTTIRVTPYEKGGITTDLKDRPAVRYDVEVKQDLPTAGRKTKASADEGATK